MTVIQQADLVDSIADALQFISYYHPLDYIQAVGRAWEKEQSPAAKDAMAQILMNSRMSAEGKRPMCQDTGIVTVFAKIGMNVRFESNLSFNEMINEGVRRAYLHPDNVLRASVVSPPIGRRVNTRDNTPAVIHLEMVPGDEIEIAVAAKGGGSENKSRFAVLNPSDDIVAWVLEQVPTMGAGWCPPGILGIGIGGTAEKAMLLAKEAILEPITIHELQARGPRSRLEELRLAEKTRGFAVATGIDMRLAVGNQFRDLSSLLQISLVLRETLTKFLHDFESFGVIGRHGECAVERGDAGQDVASGMHQGLEDRDEFRCDGELALDDLIGAALEPANPLAKHHAEGLQ